MVDTAATSTPQAHDVFPQARSCPFQPPDGYGRLRDDRPLHRVTLYSGQQAWLVTHHAEARSLLADARLSANSRSDGYPFVAARMEGMKEQPPAFIGMDAPRHTAHRRMLIPDFSNKRMRSMRPGIERIVDDYVDRMLATGPTVDLVQEFALPVTATVICELLGIPASDHEYCEEQSRLLIKASEPEQARAAGIALVGYMRDLVVKHKQNENDGGMLSRLAFEQVGSGALTDGELVQMLMLLLVAGHQTTASMIALSVAALLEYPDMLTLLRKDPAARPAIVEELLRYLSVTDVAAMRVATDDIEIAGEVIRAGEGIVVSSTLVNRDAIAFPDPDAMDPHREARAHMTFGHGPHQCLGQNLARLEVEIALATLFERIPTLRLAAPLDTLPLRAAGDVQGVDELPVTW